jgi:hypothetical protein
VVEFGPVRGHGAGECSAAMVPGLRAVLYIWAGCGVKVSTAQSLSRSSDIFVAGPSGRVSPRGSSCLTQHPRNTTEYHHSDCRTGEAYIISCGLRGAECVAVWGRRLRGRCTDPRPCHAEVSGPRRSCGDASTRLVSTKRAIPDHAVLWEPNYLGGRLGNAREL